jgi:7,8-dihydropterin-6-yl-methyl-4-(beta-D-ribofuranosyl)aminobenzene 5'-phosphate synthase
MMNLTVLVENMCGRRDVLGEFGFSMHIATDSGENILLDAGQGKTLFANAEKMDIDLGKIDKLVLSHGHFDHTWGVPALLEKAGNIPVWAHAGFDVARFRQLQEENYYIGSYFKKEDINFHPVSGLTQIAENVWTVEVPPVNRQSEFVPAVGHLVVCEDGEYKPDLFLDDISLVVKGVHGYSVILGCAHAGVVNVLHEVSMHLKTNHFHCVVGGMHIGDQSADFCRKAVAELVKSYEVEKWRPAHCTGFRAAAMLAAQHDDTSWGSCGTVISV